MRHIAAYSPRIGGSARGAVQRRHRLDYAIIIRSHSTRLLRTFNSVCDPATAVWLSTAIHLKPILFLLYLLELFDCIQYTQLHMAHNIAEYTVSPTMRM